MIRKGSISVPLLEEAVRAGRDNGQRACDIVDEKIEQALLLIRLFRTQRLFLLRDVILNGNLFQKVSSLLSERIWKKCSPRRISNLQTFGSEGIRRFFPDTDPRPSEGEHIDGSPLKDRNQSAVHKPSSGEDRAPSLLR